MAQGKGGAERTGKQAMTIAEALRGEILSGQIRPGEPLRQEQIAARFNVSRMPVRDALRILEKGGFVDMRPNRGAQVAPISVLDAREIYEMRAAAEPLALGFAMENLTNRAIKEAADILDNMKDADIAAFGEQNKAFHMTLYAPCERPRLLAHVSALNDAADRYMRIAAVTLNYLDRSAQEHEALLGACWQRDTERAVALLRAHIEDAGKRLVAEMEARGW